jgi:hypothetical protein
MEPHLMLGMRCDKSGKKRAASQCERVRPQLSLCQVEHTPPPCLLPWHSGRLSSTILGFSVCGTVLHVGVPVRAYPCSAIPACPGRCAEAGKRRRGRSDSQPQKWCHGRLDERVVIPAVPASPAQRRASESNSGPVPGVYPRNTLHTKH